MKRRVEQLINGRFDYEIPEIEFSKSPIDGIMAMGKYHRGNFSIQSVKEQKIKGTIFSSDSRVRVNPEQFLGTNTQVTYEVDITGLQPFDQVEGFFTVSSNAGEYQLPYTFKVDRKSEDSIFDKVKTLEEFKTLANSNFEEAYHLFISSGFHLIVEKEERFLSLYESFSRMPVQYRDLEEFLIAADLKEPISLSLAETSKEVMELHDSIKEVCTITKNTWGFLQIEVTTDSPFIELPKNQITTEDFIGSTFHLEYIIKEERLHGGKNFGCITFTTCYGQLDYNVIVKKEMISQRKISYRKQRPYLYQLMQLYMDYQLKRTDYKTWSQSSSVLIDELKGVNRLNTGYDLLKAQFLFLEDKPEEALEVLEEFRSNPKLLSSLEFKAYYYYLTTQYDVDTEYVQEVVEWLSRQYLQNQSRWELLWMRLHLEGDFRRNPKSRLEAIKEQFQLGCRSRVLYLEAFKVMKEEPNVIKRLERFEIQVLKWATKEELLTPELSRKISEVAIRLKNFEQGVFEVLQGSYYKYHDKETLSAICSMLIKGNKIEEKYFSWYEKGVLADLRITRLYEYYIETMNEDYNEVLPQMIRMYFGYTNTLSYRKKALIYANVIRHKEVDQDTYTNYRRTIEQFMEDQLSAGNINRDLALIYENFLTKAKINSRMTDTLSRLFFTYELRCDSDKIRSVLIQHHELKREQVVPVIDGKAFIQLYTSTYNITLQDELGKKYGTTVPYTLHRLLEDDNEIKEYVESHSNQSGLLLYKCVEEVKDVSIQMDNLIYFHKLLDTADIKEEFRLELRKKLLNFYHQNIAMEGLEYYVKQMDFEEYIIADKVKLLELLIHCGMYERAFILGNNYGYEGVDLKCLVILCSRMIWEREYEEDGKLIELSISVFLKGKYDEVMLSYLIDLYEGPLESMYQLWIGAEAFNLDAFYLSERLLLRFMFENATKERAGEIFKYYCKQSGKRRIAIAYIMYESYNYVIRERQLDPSVFEYLQEHCLRDLEVDIICEIAFLKYTSRLRELTDEQEELVIHLLETYSYQGIRFKFYKGFHEDLLQPYQIKERQFVEHICNPKSKVVMHYCIGEMVDLSEFKKEPMIHIYDGIFNKEFTLFLGEELHYFISDELEEEYHETKVVTLKGEFVRSKYEHTKYQLLNHLQEDAQGKDYDRLQKDLMNYLEGEHLVNKMFTLI